MSRVGELFRVSYGHSLALNTLNETTPELGVAFVSRTAQNNGISAFVDPVTDLQPFPAGLLTVCLRSRNYALATFVQPRPFYTGYHVHVLEPREAMRLVEKLFWADAITANRPRYNFGRQANRTLASLMLPESLPEWVRNSPSPSLRMPSSTEVLPLGARRWERFRIGEIFTLARGTRHLRRDLKPGPTPYIRATSYNNGVSASVDLNPSFEAGLITVASNGSVGEAFYQPRPFVASDDIVVLRTEPVLSAEASLFACTVIKAERYRFNYGRKWFTKRMSEHVIALPVDEKGEPDWKFAGDYVRSLPLSGVVFGVDHDSSFPSDMLLPREEPAGER